MIKNVSFAHKIDTQRIETIRVHKISSVVYRLGLTKDVKVTSHLVPTSGNVVVAKILTDKLLYNELELENGRMAKISRGDIFVGALGNRRALQGFVGEVPQSIKTGDVLQLLNRGGVVGASEMVHKDLGPPAALKILGMAVKNGRILNIQDNCLAPLDRLPGGKIAPIVLVSGTCMNSGKTFACGQIINVLSKQGFRIHGGKLTGIACRRDSIAMEDYGAAFTISFLEAGFPSTANLAPGEIVSMARTVIGHLQEGQPDIIILEMGDGIIGDYGNMFILEEETIFTNVKVHIFCACDMVGAWGGLRFLKEHNIPVHIFSGPTTDTSVGMEYIEKHLNTPAVNARLEPERLAAAVLKQLAL